MNENAKRIVGSLKGIAAQTTIALHYRQIFWYDRKVQHRCDRCHFNKVDWGSPGNVIQLCVSCAKARGLAA